MLANLLPGARELRTPLAAGCVWLFTIYLLIAPIAPKSIAEARQPIVRDIYQLVGALPPTLVLAGLAFIAYLIGALNSSLAATTIGISRKRRSERSQRFRATRGQAAAAYRRVCGKNLTHDDALILLGLEYPPSDSPLDLVVRRVGALRRDDDDFAHYLHPHLEQEVNALTPSYYSDGEGRRALRISPRSDLVVIRYIDLPYYKARLDDELRLLPSKLVSREPAVYERWSRLRSEAEFRHEVAVPIFALASVLAYRLWPADHLLVGRWPSGGVLLSAAAAFVGVAFSISIARSGRSRARESHIQLLEALDLRLAESPTLKEIDDGDIKLIPIARAVVKHRKESESAGPTRATGMLARPRFRKPEDGDEQTQAQADSKDDAG